MNNLGELCCTAYLNATKRSMGHLDEFVREKIIFVIYDAKTYNQLKKVVCIATIMYTGSNV